MNLNLSIVIVTYNCSSFIKKFLSELLFSLKGFDGYEILVLDNNSSDQTPISLKEFSSRVTIIASRENLGFAKANNQLIAKAKFENILLLNPDVFGFNKIFWDKLFELWDQKNPLFIRLLNADGSFQDCVGDVISLKRIFKHIFHLHNYTSHKEPVEVEMGIMAFLLVNKQIVDKVGLLCEDYHMYCEDMDWCYRASKSGFKNTFDPRLSLTHTGGASSASIWKAKETLIEKYKSERIFVKTQYTGIYKQVMNLIVYFKILKVKWAE